MKYLLLLIPLLCGCTNRGGWPRFLRPGEASDGAIRREEKQRKLLEEFKKTNSSSYSVSILLCDQPKSNHK